MRSKFSVLSVDTITKNARDSIIGRFFLRDHLRPGRGFVDVAYFIICDYNNCVSVKNNRTILHILRS